MISKTITLWHGSPYENKDNILKYGIRYRKPDIERMINEAVDRIYQKLRIKLTRKQANGFVRSRLQESTEKGEVVYVSGVKEYAMQNALASREWFNSILQRAIYEQNKDLYEKTRRIVHEQLKWQMKLDEYPKIQTKLMEEGKHKEWEKSNREEAKAWAQYSELSEKHSEMNKVIRQLEDKIESIFHDRRAVVFKIVMPLSVLKRLVIGEFSKDAVKAIQEGRWILDKDVEELHLKEVPRKYIRSYEVFEHKHWWKT